jgi:hypothetical protein
MDAIMTMAPCGCARFVDDGLAWVGHTEDCRARTAAETEMAVARDTQAHMDKQAMQQRLAALTPADLDRLLALDARMEALEAAAKPKPKAEKEGK